MAQNYYDLLGVSKNASESEIKRAYRKLALQWHPDRNKEPGAADKFKEITKAYEILSDSQKKAAYDQYGEAAFAPGGMGGGGQARGGQYGPFSYSYSSGGGNPFEGFNVGGFSDPFEIFEQFFGGASVRRGPRRQTYALAIEFMDAMRGTEKTVSIDGKQQTIKIPAGVDSGTRIRFENYDVVVEVRPDQKFKREDYDLLSDIELSFPQAALGDVIDVSTIDGPVKLKIQPGTQPGSLVRLRGKGVPHLRGSGRGDQYVRIKVTVPTRLSGKQKELLKEFLDASKEKHGWF
jgi:DnaJ-class molecular chaperone